MTSAESAEDDSEAKYPEISEAVITACAYIDQAGGFCNDYGALESTAFDLSDMNRSLTKVRIAAAATKAGLSGVLYEEATFIPCIAMTHAHPEGLPEDGIDGMVAIRYVDSDTPKLISEAVVENIGGFGEILERIARRAYACGVVGVGNCPLLAARPEV